MNRRKKAALLTLLGFKPKRRRAKRKTRRRGWSSVEDWVMTGRTKAPAAKKRATSTRRRTATGPRGWSAAYDQVNGKKKAPAKATRAPYRTPAERNATCSWCGARPGDRCITPSGRNTVAHVDRLRTSFKIGVR